MAASVLVSGRPPSASPNSSSVELLNVLRGLASCRKGRLTYDTNWKPTKQALDECLKAPLLSSNLSTVSPSSISVGEKTTYTLSTDAAEDNSIDEIRHSDDFSISSFVSSVGSDSEGERSERSRNAELHVLEKELQASFDDTHIAIHQYEIEKKHQAGERLNSRKERIFENSKKLLEAKNHYLRQKENERVDEVIKSVQALQEDEQRKSEEARLRQQKLEQSHKEFTERAARKVKEVEELRLRVLRQEQQIKKELQQLGVSCNSVKETAAKIQQTFQGCKFQSFLSPSVSEIQSEVNKVLKLSQNSLDSARENGQATEMNVKIIQDCIVLIQSSFQKAKTLVHEANSKAAKEEAERQAQEEAKAKEEEKRQQALKASKEKQNTQPSTSASQTSDSKSQSKAGISKELSSCISAAAWKEYSRLATYKSQIVESAEPLNTDKSLKQYKFDLHKAVTTPINAISDQSPSHLLDKIQRLTKLLSGQSVQVGGKQISISKHAAAKHFCKELLARKLVQQGSQQVSSSHSSAFPIAAVITGIWSSYPDVGDLILAQFYDQCPFLVPFYIPRAAELSDAEYFASLGYQCSEGEIEEQDKFLKRMTGLVRLYAAVISSIPPSGKSNQHPYGLDNGWTWLSRMLNLEPRANYTATALYEFLAVAGHALMRKYKKQFGKLLNTLVLECVPKIEKVTDKAQSGPVVRLKVFLEACIKDQKIPVPDGYLTPHWWRSSSF